MVRKTIAVIASFSTAGRIMPPLGTTSNRVSTGGSKDACLILSKFQVLPTKKERRSAAVQRCFRGIYPIIP